MKLKPLAFALGLIGLFFFSKGLIAQDDLKLSERILPADPENFFKTEGYFNWCGSVVKGEDGKYHLFYSRWPEASKFSGWLLFSEVAHAVADSPAGPWEYRETVLEGSGPGHWDAITAHNPKIKHFEGKYYLYYASTHLNPPGDFAKDKLWQISKQGPQDPLWKSDLRPNQRTGVAVASSLNGP